MKLQVANVLFLAALAEPWAALGMGAGRRAASSPRKVALVAGNHTVPAALVGMAAGRPNLPAFLISLANDCQCKYVGTCSCEGSLEFMKCIRNGCSSGKCGCTHVHFEDACQTVGKACPPVGMQCAAKEATCNVNGAAEKVEFRGNGTDLDWWLKELEKEGAVDDDQATWVQAVLVRVVAITFIGPFFCVWAIFIVLFAFLYDYSGFRFKVRPHVANEIVPQGPRSGFHYPCYNCLLDVPICMMSWCCPALRWADTLDKASGLLRYWPAIGLFIGLAVLEFLLMVMIPQLGNLVQLITVFAGVYYRQGLRRVLLLDAEPSQHAVEDCCIWLCCPCCAITQEAREVELKRERDQKLPPPFGP